MNDNDQEKVEVLPVQTRHNIPPSRTLVAALCANLQRVTVIGRNQDGTMWAASSNSDIGHTLHDIEIFKRDFL